MSMTLTHPLPVRDCCRTALPALCLVGITGADSAIKDSAAAALVARGYQSIAFADAIRTEIAAQWRIDTRLLQERVTQETPLEALACSRSADPLFVTWAVYHGHRIMEPRSPAWLVRVWREYRRQQYPLYFVRIVERWLLDQVNAGQRHLALTDVDGQGERDLVRFYGGKLLQVAGAPRAGQAAPAGAREVDTLIASDSPDMLVQLVMVAVEQMLGAEALCARRTVQ